MLFLLVSLMLLVGSSGWPLCPVTVGQRRCLWGPLLFPVAVVWWTHKWPQAHRPPMCLICSLICCPPFVLLSPMSKWNFKVFTGCNIYGQRERDLLGGRKTSTHLVTKSKVFCVKVKDTELQENWVFPFYILYWFSSLSRIKPHVLHCYKI